MINVLDVGRASCHTLKMGFECGNGIFGGHYFLVSHVHISCYFPAVQPEKRRSAGGNNANVSDRWGGGRWNFLSMGNVLSLLCIFGLVCVLIRMVWWHCHWWCRVSLNKMDYLPVLPHLWSEIRFTFYVEWREHIDSSNLLLSAETGLLAVFLRADYTMTLMRNSARKPFTMSRVI